MKALFIVLLSLIISSEAFAQITVSQAAKRVEVNNEIIPYDSTKNFLGNKNVKSYIGQTLYVNGISKGLREYGYDHFKYKKEAGVCDGRWGQPAIKSGYHTKYEDLVGKYFVVLDVQADSRQKESYLYRDYWWFLLQNRDKPSEIMWFRYQGDYWNEFPFITVSYFNYIKTSLIGKRYILKYTLKDQVVSTSINDIDFNTGKLINQSIDDVWECIDITIEDEYFKLVAVVRNQNKEISTIPISSLFTDSGKVFVFEEPEYNTLKNKYGAEIMDLVRQSIIKVGMPKHLLLLSWGTPNSINNSSYGPEQWVYGSTYCSYVYVENDVITAWN